MQLHYFPLFWLNLRILQFHWLLRLSFCCPASHWYQYEYYLCRLFFLRGFYIVFHILNFCAWEILYHNMFFMLYWFRDSIAINVFYNGVSKDNCCKIRKPPLAMIITAIKQKPKRNFWKIPNKWLWYYLFICFRDFGCMQSATWGNEAPPRLYSRLILKAFTSFVLTNLWQGLHKHQNYLINLQLCFNKSKS